MRNIFKPVVESHQVRKATCRIVFKVSTLHIRLKLGPELMASSSPITGLFQMLSVTRVYKLVVTLIEERSKLLAQPSEIFHCSVIASHRCDAYHGNVHLSNLVAQRISQMRE